MKRRGKTAQQQARYYEVEDIFEYMVKTYVYGNFSIAVRLYNELCRKDRNNFILYCFDLDDRRLGRELVRYVINNEYNL